MKIFRLRRAARWRLLRRRGFDWPSIFIACSGLGLWLLWPNNLSSISKMPQLQKPMVSFIMQKSGAQQLYRNPTIFALPSIYGFGAINDVSGMPDVKDVWYNSSPHYLARDAVGDNEDRTLKILNSATDQQQRKINNLRVILERKSIFTDSLVTNRKINVVYHGDLRKYKFEMPEIDIKSFDKDKSWIVRLLVHVDEKGYPDQIFIEKGSNIPEVDAKIIRLINQGRLKLPGKSCEGRVTVNFGL